MFDEDRSIISRDAEGDSGANVAEDGIADGIGHLSDVLVGDGKIKTVFTGFGKNDRERIGGKVLELIDIKIEWTAITDIWDVGAAHGSELNFSDKEGAKNAGVVFAD